MQHRQRAPGYATLICMARQRVARRAPGGPPKAEPGADAGPAGQGQVEEEAHCAGCAQAAARAQRAGSAVPPLQL